MSKIQYGWICPRCKKVHSPLVIQCDCSPNESGAISAQSLYQGCIHDWTFITNDKATYNHKYWQCQKCGTISQDNPHQK